LSLIGGFNESLKISFREGKEEAGEEEDETIEANIGKRSMKGSYMMHKGIKPRLGSP